MKKFISLQELINNIEDDKQIAILSMNDTLRLRFQNHKFFKN